MTSGEQLFVAAVAVVDALMCAVLSTDKSCKNLRRVARVLCALCVCAAIYMAF